MTSLGFSNPNETKICIPRSTKVKNKNHAPIQITAEHIIQQARKLQEPENNHHASPKITNLEELQDYRLRKRNEYENQVRRSSKNTNKNVWVKYARWEESQKDFERARSVWERALEGDYKDHTLWLGYVKFEMRNRFVNHARNIFDRAVSLLPRVDKLWSSYIHMEKSVGNVAGAQNVLERWMIWNPNQPTCQPEPEPKPKAICNEQYVDRDETYEDTIVTKKRFEYEEELKRNPLDYDSWFDYIRLKESLGNKEMIREVYERAIANVPPAEEKRYWQRYIYLWIKYGLYEELCAQDISRTREIYNACLKLIPHRKFSFSKMWLLAANFEIRRLNLCGARAILGRAIGLAPRHKIFKKYIEMELGLGNVDRCRKLYGKYLEWSPKNCYTWCKYAELERSLNESERARAIFELAIAQPTLDVPEMLWKSYIDFEIAEGEFRRARQLYERLLDRTKHLQVWISYALFEASTFKDVQKQRDVPQDQKQLCIQRVRRVFENAIDYYKTSAPELKEERVMLLEEWFKIECGFGELGDVELVRVKLPKKLKRKYDESVDYIFPEESQVSNLKILEQAYKWKKRKLAMAEDDSIDH